MQDSLSPVVLSASFSARIKPPGADWAWMLDADAAPSQEFPTRTRPRDILHILLILDILNILHIPKILHLLHLLC